MSTFVVYFILVCFQLNLTVRFKGVQYHVETHLFLYQKPTQNKFNELSSNLSKFQRDSEHASNCKNFASTKWRLKV